MSADLLRRAAEKLRRAEGRLVMTWGSPWRVVITDSESGTGVATCEDHQLAPHDACDNCEHFETYYESVAEYCSVMHPPVALALADLMERAAVTPTEVDNDVWAEFEHLARQILCEPS